jgi:hypothetical protein
MRLLRRLSGTRTARPAGRKGRSYERCGFGVCHRRPGLRPLEMLGQPLRGRDTVFGVLPTVQAASCRLSTNAGDMRAWGRARTRQAVVVRRRGSGDEGAVIVRRGPDGPASPGASLARLLKGQRRALQRRFVGSTLIARLCRRVQWRSVLNWGARHRADGDFEITRTAGHVHADQCFFI